LEACYRLVDKKDKIASYETSIDSLDQANINDVISHKKELSKLLQHIAWPSGLVKPSNLQSAYASLEKLSNIEQKLLLNKKEDLKKIDQSLVKLKADIDAGRLKDASKTLKDLQNSIQSFPAKDTSRQQQSLRDLSAQLYELRDWQGFATTPKKEQLCNEMEALVGVQKDPQDLADAIKALQDQWKSLGRAEPLAERDLWNRFKAAGDKAYEPCKIYFSELADTRANNLAKRQQLCTQLDEYAKNMNWSGSVDWNNVLEILKTAKREWRSYSPVERRANQAVQEAFDASLANIQQRLDNERDRNAKKKSMLIEKVTELAEHQDIAHAVNETKQLQREWKEIGMVQRKEDQKLWKAFRAACDQIFVQRQQKQDEADAERNGNQEKAQAVCDALRSFSKESDEVLINSKGKLKNFHEDFANCQPLPKAVAAKLKAEFEQLTQELATKIQQAKIKRESASYDRLWEKADICTELEQAILNSSLDDSRLNEFKERWNDTGDLPEAAISAMNARFDAAIDLFSGDQVNSMDEQLHQELARNLESMHVLTLQMEILAGIESPAEDQNKRMELQVARLSQSMQGSAKDSQTISGNQRQSTQQSEQERRSLLIDWCALGPVAEQDSKNFRERFKQAFSAQA